VKEVEDLHKEIAENTHQNNKLSDEMKDKNEANNTKILNLESQLKNLKDNENKSNTDLDKIKAENEENMKKLENEKEILINENKECIEKIRNFSDQISEFESSALNHKVYIYVYIYTYIYVCIYIYLMYIYTYTYMLCFEPQGKFGMFSC
jgi:DNA repair exonuclease SbcCD ATPase subunit